MAYNIFGWDDIGDNPGKPNRRKSTDNLTNMFFDFMLREPETGDPNVKSGVSVTLPKMTQAEMDAYLLAMAEKMYPGQGSDKMANLKEVEIMGRRSPITMKEKSTSPIVQNAIGYKPKYLGSRAYYPQSIGSTIPTYKWDESKDDLSGDMSEAIGSNTLGYEPTEIETEKWRKEKVKKEKGDSLGTGDLTLGDKVGMYGGIAGTLLNTGLTIANRLGDNKNTNTFLTYAQDSIRTMDESKRYAQNMFDYALQDIDFTEGSARRNIVQNARGINQQRALELGLHVQGQQAKRKARVDYASSMLGINRDISRLQERHDYYSMSGEERRLDKDKADRDAFFTNLSSNITDATMLAQNIGKSLNDSLETQQRLKILEQYGKYSKFDEDFNLVGKPMITDNSSGNNPVATPSVAQAAPAGNAYKASILWDEEEDLAFPNSINSPLSMSYYKPLTVKRPY